MKRNAKGVVFGWIITNTAYRKSLLFRYSSTERTENEMYELPMYCSLISVQKMCFGYEIRVPENYTALSGDLDILIIDLLRSPLEDVRLELLEVEYVRRENVKLKKPESGTLENRSTPEEVDKYNHLNDSLTRLANLSALNKSVEFNKIPLIAPARTFRSSQSQIPQIEVERKWTVIHSSSVPFSNDSRSVRVKFPCGVVTRGGHFGVRLTGHDDKINNLTMKTRGHACRKSERTSCIEKVGVKSLDYPSSTQHF